MQMQIGRARFEAQGVEYQDLRRRRTRRWTARDRRGRHPAIEDLGPDADTLSLDGVVWIERLTQLSALDDLVEEGGLNGATEARGLPLFAGGGNGSSGEFLGYWVVRALEVREGKLRFDSIPTRLEFHIELLQETP